MGLSTANATLLGTLWNTVTTAATISSPSSNSRQHMSQFFFIFPPPCARLFLPRDSKPRIYDMDRLNKQASPPLPGGRGELPHPGHLRICFARNNQHSAATSTASNRRL